VAGRNPYIDMLRGVSILLVMLLHYTLSYRLHNSPLANWVSVPTLRAIFYNGNYGVSLFFVISGFLITSNAIERYGSLANVDVVHFYKLRLFRLYPLVVLALVVIAALGAAGFPNFSNRIDGADPGTGFLLLANLSVLTFWHNVLMEMKGYFNYAMNIYWSLSVEEVFYLLYPLVLVVARRGWQLAFVAAVCVIAGPFYRFVHSDDELFYLYGNVACVDMLTFGCVAAVVARRVSLRKAARVTLALVACVAMGWIYMLGIGGHEALGASLLGMGAGVFLVAVGSPNELGSYRVGAGWGAGRVVRTLGRPLGWLGGHSYELYLFHIVVLGIIVDRVPRAAMPVEDKLPMLAVFVVLSVILAWLTSRFVGTPLNRRLRSRFAQDRGRVGDAT
jgi:peptidoglycan/LPS O-acetylase OafA/YrhL